jgi:hypothetical protein
MSSTPNLTALSPDEGHEGQTIVIHGSDLAGTKKVIFQDPDKQVQEAKAFNIISGLQVEADVPAGLKLGYGRVYVETGDSKAVKSNELTFLING